MGIVLRTCIVGLVALLCGTGSSYATLTYDPNVTSAGLRYLRVSGEFTSTDDLSVFSRAVFSSGSTVVTFDSGGGNVYKAMELGRAIRAHGLATIQFRQAGECSSACSLAFMGGILRLADPGAIGVHKSSFSPSLGLSAEQAVSAVQQATADVVSYMVEMGIDPSLLQLSLSYDSSDIRYLSASEMERFGVTKSSPGNSGQRGEMVARSTQAPPPQSSPGPTSPNFDIPTARTGKVRHPKGAAPIKASPTEKTENLSVAKNGMRVEIIDNKDRWYRIRIGGFIGYMHHTWVYVDQYQSGRFDHRHIQVKSFDNYSDAETYIRSANLPLSAYLATNGWFAITLTETFPEAEALPRTKALKSAGVVPDDSFMTYGNTYVRKVCCQ